MRHVSVQSEPKVWKIPQNNRDSGLEAKCKLLPPAIKTEDVHPDADMSHIRARKKLVKSCKSDMSQAQLRAVSRLAYVE